MGARESKMRPSSSSSITTTDGPRSPNGDDDGVGGGTSTRKATASSAPPPSRHIFDAPRSNTENSNGATMGGILAGIVSSDESAAALIEDVRKIVLRDIGGVEAEESSSSTMTRDGGDEEGGKIDSEPSTRSERVATTSETSDAGGRSRDLDRKRVAETDGGGDRKEGGDNETFLSKDSEFYRQVYSAALWQRDSFLVGPKFAKRRGAERNSTKEDIGSHEICDLKGRTLHGIGAATFVFKEPMQHRAVPRTEPQAAGYPLLLSTAEQYIVSSIVYNALQPKVSWVVSTDGPLLLPAQRALSQSIPLAQSLSDDAIRNSVLWSLKDHGWRDFAKSSITTGYQYADRGGRGK